ncbi:unnamed protein product [Zymoseptoria tritici ST99CH_1E4]|uniref:Rhodopsin domain-containing protein n=1 Tax=Zymoseptoria tritici ST99CH_1E4 TaxID=1276532 RepID=A0A2H1G5E4_ZYMTR|nr:unnamed protein product [Zymoseptoria tritici ST99CH_1E4]
MTTVLFRPLESASLWTQAVPNKSPTLIIISIIFFSLTTLIFATRLAWRLHHHQRGWDDLFAILAFITLTIQTAFGITAAHYGFGKHRSDILSTFSHAMFYFYLYQICYKLLGGFTKLTFCALYLAIFPPSHKNKWFRRVVWLTADVTVMGMVAFTLATIWQCTPVRKAWHPEMVGRCIDNLRFWYAYAAFNTFMDIVVYILPIPVIGSLQVSTRTRAGLLSMFGLGALVIAASIVRMVMLKGSAESFDDPTWGSMPALLCTEVEANLAVIVCSLPALRVLGVKIWRAIRSRSLSATELNGTAETRKGAAKIVGEAENGLRLGSFTRIRYSPPSSPPATKSHPFKRKRLADGPLEYREQSPFDRLYSTMRLGPSLSESKESLEPRQSLASKLDWGGAIHKSTEVKVESRSRDSMALEQSVQTKPMECGAATLEDVLKAGPRAGPRK